MNNINTAQAVQSANLPSLPPTGFSRLPAVRGFAGNAAGSTIYLWIKQNRFPRGVKLSPRVTVWRNEDLHRWAADPLAWQAANQGADHAGTKKPHDGGQHWGCGLNSTIQERTAQHAAVADGASPRFPLMSTAAEAQRYRLIEALRTGPKNSYELRRLGIYQVPARVFELRRQGHDISTERISLTDEDGYLHPQCALYRLLAVAQDVC